MLTLQIRGSVVSTSISYSCQASPCFPFYAPLLTISLPYTYLLFLPTYLCLVFCSLFLNFIFSCIFSKGSMSQQETWNSYQTKTKMWLMSCYLSATHASTDACITLLHCPCSSIGCQKQCGHYQMHFKYRFCCFASGTQPVS